MLLPSQQDCNLSSWFLPACWKNRSQDNNCSCPLSSLIVTSLSNQLINGVLSVFHCDLSVLAYQRKGLVLDFLKYPGQETHWSKVNPLAFYRQCRARRTCMSGVCMAVSFAVRFNIFITNFFLNHWVSKLSTSWFIPHDSSAWEVLSDLFPTKEKVGAWNLSLDCWDESMLWWYQDYI